MGLKEDLIRSQQAKKEGYEVEEINEPVEEEDALEEEHEELTEDISFVLDEEQEDPIFDEPVIEEEFQLEQDPVPVFDEPELFVEQEPLQFEPTPQSMSTPVVGASKSSGLDGELLKLAKTTLMEDIKDNFDSSFLTPEAKQNIINCYVNGEDAKLSNATSILASLIDEVISSNYSHNHYKNLVQDILNEVKSDLGF